jgi:hypothetical protein
MTFLVRQNAFSVRKRHGAKLNALCKEFHLQFAESLVPLQYCQYILLYFFFFEQLIVVNIMIVKNTLTLKLLKHGRFERKEMKMN